MIAINYELLKTAQKMAEVARKIQDEMGWASAREVLKEAYGYEDKEANYVH